MKQAFRKYLIYVLFAGLLYIPVFGYLGNLPIRQYDESRLAMNAWEMARTGNLIVTTFHGAPDMWNTKPPLLIWCQAGLIKIMGSGEIPVRIPSALAAFFTLLAVFLLGRRYIKDEWFGFIAFLVLLTSAGYIEPHVTRTGDYDAMLTMFTTLGCISFFTWTETGKTKYLYYFFLLLAGGVLTKGITGLLFTPALLIWAIIRKQLLPALKNPHVYYALGIFLFLVLGYYFLRESQNPGYLKAVAKNELGGRFLEVNEQHKGDFWYYYFWLHNFQYAAYFLLIPCGFVTGLLSRDNRIRRLALFSSLMTIIFFIIISIAKTKLWWYHAPMFPFMALIVACFLHFIFKYLNNLPHLAETLKFNIIPYIFLFLIFVTPYQMIIKKTYIPQESWETKDLYDIGYYLRKSVRGKIDLNGQILVVNGYHPQVEFYVNILQEKHTDLTVQQKEKLQPGNVAITFQPDIAKYIEETYNCEQIGKFQNSVITYRINGRKSI